MQENLTKKSGELLIVSAQLVDLLPFVALHLATWPTVKLCCLSLSGDIFQAAEFAR